MEPPAQSIIHLSLMCGALSTQGMDLDLSSVLRLLSPSSIPDVRIQLHAVLTSLLHPEQPPLTPPPCSAPCLQVTKGLWAAWGDTWVLP